MNKHFLKNLLIAARDMDAPPKEPSERAKELFEAALARHQSAKVLPLNAMKVVILNLLNKGTLTGSEIIDKLAELHLEMEPKGDGAILGLLHQMEMEGMVAIQFHESTATRRYKIDDAGSDLLRRKETSVVTEFGLSALLGTP